MRLLVVFVLVAMGACGSFTKTNPNACCTDQADCQAAGIPVGTDCAQGLVCRGNQCIAEVCTGSSDCDLSAPFCVDMSCAATCTEDTQCPGNGGDASSTFCENGGCVHCRAGGSDCPSDAPVCDMGACRGCKADTDCSSAVCDLDTGTCIDETKTVYASPTGSATSTCGKTEPCTLDRAWAVIDASRPNIKLADGTYTSIEDFTGTYTLSIYGPATANSFDINANTGRLRLRDLALRNASCEVSSIVQPLPSIDIARVQFTADLSNGGAFASALCNAVVSHTSFAGTGDGGALIALSGTGGGNSTVSFDSCRFGAASPSSAAFLIEDPTVVNISNSIFENENSHGVFQLSTGTQGGENVTVSFSTFYNSTLTCPTNNNVIVSTTNSIFLNQSSGAPTNTVGGTGCAFAYDLIKPQATAVGATNLLGMDPRFVNAGSGDYHLTAGSPAIDAADPAATDATDYDGTARPQGTARDMGAFEYKP